MLKNKQTILISTLVLLLLLPMLYLFIKTSGAPDLPKEQTVAVPPAQTNITSLENAVKTNPTFDNLINLSMGYINNQMPGKSIDYLKKALELNRNSAIAYNNLGVAYTMLQQYQNGMDACTKALQIDTSFQLAKNNLKWANDEKSKVIAAIQVQEHMDGGKKNTAFYIDYGLNYFKIGNYDKSIEIWNRIFDKEPKSTAALNNIGTAFMMKNQIDDAAALFKKALALEPDNALAKNNLAWAMGEKDKAAQKK